MSFFKDFLDYFNLNGKEKKEKSYEGIEVSEDYTETSDYLKRKINRSFLYFIEECEHVCRSYEKNAPKEEILNSFEKRLEGELNRKYVRDTAEAYWILRFKIPELNKKMKIARKDGEAEWVRFESQITYLEFKAADLISNHLQNLWV